MSSFVCVSVVSECDVCDHLSDVSVYVSSEVCVI